MDSLDTEPRLRLLQKKKLKKNFTSKKRLIFVSKSLFDLKVKGYQGKAWVAMQHSSLMHFMCVRCYLNEFWGGHVIVFRIKTFDNVAT